MDIRPFESNDREAVLAVWLAASRVGHPFLTEEELGDQQRLVEKNTLERAEIWVAEEGGQVQGFIGLLGSYLGGLFVAPSLQRKGIGHKLVEHAFQLKGPLSVEVYADNPIAPAFYRDCGFVELARLPHDDEGRPFPLLVMKQWGGESLPPSIPTTSPTLFLKRILER